MCYTHENQILNFEYKLYLMHDKSIRCSIKYNIRLFVDQKFTQTRSRTKGIVLPERQGKQGR